MVNPTGTITSSVNEFTIPVNEFPSATLQYYKENLHWLRNYYPEEFAKLPEALLNDTRYFQLHGECVDSDQDDSALKPHWVIAFIPCEQFADELVGEEIHLAISRPPDTRL